MTNTITTANGLFKETYADKLEKLQPQINTLAELIPFVTDEARNGNEYHQPVMLSREQGWTLNAGAGSAYTLNSAEAATSKDAQVTGAEFVLNSAVSYGAMARGLSSQNKSSQKRAFVKMTAYVLENMLESATWVREIQLLYGGGTAGSEGIGIINSQTDDSGTSQTFDITLASWADGIWAGTENMYVDVWNAALDTQRNSSGTMKITSVDLDNRQVTFLGTEAEMDNIVATDVVFLRGGKGAEMAGLEAILGNSGTLFNISASTYSLWKATSHSAGSAQLTFAKLLRALNKPAGRGLTDEYCYFTSVNGWTDVMNDLSALRRYSAKAGGKLEQGSDALTFYGQTGSVMVKPHIMVKNGHAMGFAPRYGVRPGASDITFNLPGGNENFFYQSESSAGIGMRCYWNMGLFFRRPATMSEITNIVNSTN